MCYCVPMDDSLWHILRVKTGFEDEIALSSGYPAYVPKKYERHYNRRQRKNVVRVSTLLPSFVFVKVRTPQDFEVPPSSRVFGFLRNGDGSPGILSDKAFRLLRQVERENKVWPTNTKTEPEPVKVGDDVHVSIAFAMEAALAKVLEIRGKRAVVQFVGSQLRLEIDTDALAA